MSFLSEEEKEALSINRMIFHVIDHALEKPTLLDEIAPPQFTDFFLERIKASLRGNLFEFRTESPVEKLIRAIAKNGDSFAEQTQNLATKFQQLHTGQTSPGVFFLFELSVGNGACLYALIKYDNEDVVRYQLQNGASHVPLLERFRETFVRKPEAMQKIALVRLDVSSGGRVMVKDRSKKTSISDYFERFLQVRRVNSPNELSGKLINALRETFKDLRSSLPPDVQRSGVNRIYEVLRQGGHQFDPENLEPLITPIFGPVAEDPKFRKTLEKKLKDHGVSEETFDIDPIKIQKPRRRRLDTEENTQIFYDESYPPRVEKLENGRERITIETSRVTRDDIDVDTEKRPRRS